jgi:hypothetical protein
VLSTFSWSLFSLYFSASNTQTFLKKCYQDQYLQNSEQKSYENCYPFIYYLEHGKVYYNQAKNSPLIIQPILIFYGLVHLIKACILTINPDYPETTSVLAHGVSTRKRKKQQYNFFQDEVKIQRNGLFPLMCEQLFHMKQLEVDKITMSELFQQIPELNDLFYLLEGKNTFFLVNNHDNSFYLPLEALDRFHMTENRFVEFFIKKTNGETTFRGTDKSHLVFEFERVNAFNYSPLKYNLMKEVYAFPLEKNHLLAFHELLIHYLLLYNLSMIARYETEWWSELNKTMPNKDFPFIETFLNITLTKGPFLIHQYLIGKK